ncbi:MAG: hypothetical protein GY849_03590 [Deltaproteobacteria bacterium]|nr:hypothetical protein [Deltaproteobacteria bacterium]
MKKWILIGCGALVIIIVVVLILGISNLGPIIKEAVNTHGPGITKTELRLGDVGISIFSGEAKLKDFHMGNPRGFQSASAMDVGSIYVDLDEGSLTGDTIIIDRVEVVGPEITYEKAGIIDNFKAIINNVKRSVGAGGPSKKKQPEKKEGGDKKFLIRNFILKSGKVNLALSIPGGKSITAELPDIHLKDVGKENGGASAAEVFEQVLAAIYKEITSSDVTDVLNKELKSLGLDLDEIGKGVPKSLKPLTEKIKGLFGK